jgi:3-oxoacyl-[acyl-carrier protein] reductase
METGLSGKNVLITGASGGIGQSIARLFADEGANVLVHYNQGRERAEQLVTQLSLQTNAVACQADLVDENAVEHLFQQAVETLGPIQILIANAGDWPTVDETIDQMSLARWNQTIANNLTSVFLSCRSFLQHCETSQITDPAIVMTGSTAGYFGEANHGDYAAAKSGLMGGLLQSLKNEIPRKFPAGRVNAVCPGWTMTPMADRFRQNPEGVIRALQTIALKKIGQPEDVAKAVLFFACNKLSGHVTGQSLFVSGGMEGRVLNSTDEVDLAQAL